MQAKVERRHREAAVRVVRLSANLAHLVDEWVTRGVTIPHWAVNAFAPLVLVAAEFADAEARGYAACQADVTSVLKAREEAELSAYAAWRDSEGYLNCAHDDEHPGGIRADAFASFREEIERGEHVGKAKP